MKALKLTVLTIFLGLAASSSFAFPITIDPHNYTGCYFVGSPITPVQKIGPPGQTGNPQPAPQPAGPGATPQLPPPPPGSGATTPKQDAPSLREAARARAYARFKCLDDDARKEIARLKQEITSLKEELSKNADVVHEDAVQSEAAGGPNRYYEPAYQEALKALYRDLRKGDELRDKIADREAQLEGLNALDPCPEQKPHAQPQPPEPPKRISLAPPPPGTVVTVPPNTELCRTAAEDKEMLNLHAWPYVESLSPEQKFLIEGRYQYLDSLPPCPPKTALNVYFGGALIKNFGKVRSTETLAATDAVTNQFDDSGDPLGFGVVAGDNLTVGTIVVGPFVSFDLLNQTINHTFTAGSFLGTTTHWNVLAGAKVGIVTTGGVFVYGLGGVSWLNHDLNINFGRGATSSSTTTRGYAFGGGVEFRPRALQGGRVPLGVFVQYQHTMWQDAPLSKPAASPTFNYTFGRSDDTIKFGVNVYFGGSTPPPTAPPGKTITN